MIEYVLGLAFNEQEDKVLLINKKHGPPHIIKQWNGIGGKMEENETGWEAMAREFKEE